MRAQFPLLLAVLAAPACHGGPPTPINPSAEVAVTVENQSFADMTVYLIRSGQRIRIGMVPSLSTRILMVRPELIGYGTEVRFEAHPIGTRGSPASEEIHVNPGDVIHLVIPPR